jgi:hypothetical protein
MSYVIDGPAYRAVIVIKDFRGLEVKDYRGYYDKPGPAKAQVTIARKNRSGFVNGWVELSSDWERLE